MEKKGQWHLLIGVLLSIGAILLTCDFVPDREVLDFFHGMITGISLVLVISGIVLIIRSKMRKK